MRQMLGFRRDRGWAEEVLRAQRCGKPKCSCAREIRGRQALTHCPAHDDEDPSLSITVGGEKVLVRCFAGCSQRAVLAALDKRLGRVSPVVAHKEAKLVSLPPRGGSRGHDYHLRDEEGNIVAIHRRIESGEEKRFEWLKPDGTPGLGGKSPSELPLYGTHLLRDRPAEAVIITEGEKAAEHLCQLGFLALGTVTGAAAVPSEERLKCLQGRKVYLWPDNDAAGQRHMERIARILMTLGTEAYRINWPEAPDKGDAADLVEQLEHEEARRRIERLMGEAKPYVVRYASTLKEILELGFPKREAVLEPVFFERDLIMIHAWRGTGKTYFALGLAGAIARGGRFLAWVAPKPRRVLYVDGELPGRTLQERLARLARPARCEERAQAEALMRNFLLMNPDLPALQDRPLPKLSRPEGREWFLAEIALCGAEVVIFDSISTLCGIGAENDAEQWAPVEEFLLTLRRLGRTVVLLHHDSKAGAQRGTSRREDVLDVVIHLKRPEDYDPSQGLRTLLTFEKARSLTGEATAEFELKLEEDPDSGGLVFTRMPPEPSKAERLAEMVRDGKRKEEICETLGIKPRQFYNLREQARSMGLLQ